MWQLKYGDLAEGFEEVMEKQANQAAWMQEMRHPCSMYVDIGNDFTRFKHKIWHITIFMSETGCFNTFTVALTRLLLFYSM